MLQYITFLKTAMPLNENEINLSPPVYGKTLPLNFTITVTTAPQTTRVFFFSFFATIFFICVLCRKLARSQEMHFSIRNFYKCVKGWVPLAKAGNMSVSSHHKFKPLTDFCSRFQEMISLWHIMVLHPLVRWFVWVDREEELEGDVKCENNTNWVFSCVV